MDYEITIEKQIPTSKLLDIISKEKLHCSACMGIINSISLLDELIVVQV